MAKLEQDNKILAELDCKLKNVSASGLAENTDTHQMSSSLPSLTSSHLFQSSVLTDTSVGSTADFFSKPSSHTIAQNGTTQQINLMNDQQLEDLRLENLANSIAYENEIANREKKSKMTSRIEGTPYSYDPIIKYSSYVNPGAFIDKSMSLFSIELCVDCKYSLLYFVLI